MSNTLPVLIVPQADAPAPGTIPPNLQTDAPTAAPQVAATNAATGTGWQAAGFSVDPPTVDAPNLLKRPVVKAGHPDPSAVRPKKRLLPALVVVLFTFSAGIAIWNSFFRYRASGIVTATTIELSLDDEGLMQETVVSEGMQASKGELLCVLENQTLREKFARIADDLAIAKGELAAEESRARWEMQVAQDGQYRLTAECHLEQGRLQEQEALLERQKTTFERIARLYQRQAATLEQFDKARLDLQGQTSLVAELKHVVENLRSRVESAETLVGKLNDRLAPKVAQVAALQSETERLRKRLDQLHVVAPADATVVKWHRRPGERSNSREPLVTLLLDSTREVVLYVSEADCKAICRGNRVFLGTESGSGELSGMVARVEDSLQPAPENIQTQYRRGERLLAVHVQPDAANEAWPNLPLHSVVKLARWGGVETTQVSP